VTSGASLGTLFVAAQFLDLLWPILLLLGIERVEISPGITQFNPLDFVSYPISHSLLMVCDSPRSFLLAISAHVLQRLSWWRIVTA
jgi:hypothetical protein